MLHHHGRSTTNSIPEQVPRDSIDMGSVGHGGDNDSSSTPGAILQLLASQATVGQLQLRPSVAEYRCANGHPIAIAQRPPRRLIYGYLMPVTRNWYITTSTTDTHMGSRENESASL